MRALAPARTGDSHYDAPAHGASAWPNRPLPGFRRACGQLDRPHVLDCGQCSDSEVNRISRHFDAGLRNRKDTPKFLVLVWFWI
jgi:hypothetical protein